MRKERLYGPFVILITWYILFLLHFINPLFLPPPHSVIGELGRLIIRSEIWIDIAASIWRILIGFIISCTIGIPIGLLMGNNPRIRNAFEIVIDFFRSLPALAIFPLLMFFFGIGNTAKIATTVFSCSMIIIINSMYGVITSNKTRQIIAKAMDANKFEIFTKVIFKDALPHIFIGMRMSLSLAVVVVIVTEMFVGSNWGIGHRIFESQLTYRVLEMYASIIIAGVIGYGLNMGFLLIETRIIHWSGK